MSTTVMIAREATELDAQIIAGRLEADGIETFVNGAVLASTIGPVNEYNSSWSNPLGGVEIRVRTEDEAEARAIVAEIASQGREARAKRNFPNALQILVGMGLSLVALETGSEVHPVLGYIAAVAVLVGTVVLARK